MQHGDGIGHIREQCLALLGVPPGKLSSLTVFFGETRIFSDFPPSNVPGVTS